MRPLLTRLFRAAPSLPVPTPGFPQTSKALNSTMASPQLTVQTMNPHLVEMEYAVRGPIVIRAVELEKELAAGAKKPFTDVIKANIGDAHAMGQPPMTFIRQVLACCAYPPLIEDSDFPSDVKEKAKSILAACGGKSVGSYSMSNGIEKIRQDVAHFIEERDGGVACSPENIYLSGGASEAIRNLLKTFIYVGEDQKPAGVMIPIPQYPLYSATVAEFGLHQIGYYLDEANHWGVDDVELQRSYDEAKKVSNPRVLVIINPGNPTGQVQSEENIKNVIRFAHKNNLFLFADEVYQDNVYAEGCKFHSFKKVMTNMGPPYSQMELASFHSVSKGYMGECGLRGGYAEIINVQPDVIATFKKSVTAKLCSTVLGQATMDCVVNHPKPGDPSYDLWSKERSERLKSLAERAKLVEDTLNSIPGIKCNPVQGAMYAFPRLLLPQKAIDKARSLNQEPDFFYAMQLLENTGICIIPGSGFGQRDGTFHFRTTILPQLPLFQDMMNRFKEFHVGFMKTYE